MLELLDRIYTFSCQRLCIFNCQFYYRISDLLVNGTVMNQFFQPFETHIPFILQVRLMNLTNITLYMCLYTYITFFYRHINMHICTLFIQFQRMFSFIHCPKNN